PCSICFFFFFSSRRRHTRFSRDWSSDVCSSDLAVDDVAVGIDKASEYFANATALGQLFQLCLIDKPVFEDRALPAQRPDADKNHIGRIRHGADVTEQAV